MKHTPGPWKIADNTLIYALNGKGNNIFCCKVMPGCKCGCITASQKELEANARLIAAAPDLLKALRELVKQDDGLYPAYSLGWKIIKRAELAIAKTVSK